MVRSLSVLTTALVLLSAASAGAQEDFARNGPYLGVAGVFGRQRFNDDVEDALNEQLDALGYVVSSELKGSFGIEGVLGYRLHRFVSAEVKGQWLLGFEGDVDMLEKGPNGEFPQGQNFLPEIASMEFDIATVTANLKAHLLTGPWQPYLLVGGGMMHVESEIKESSKLYELSDRIGPPEELVPDFPDWPGIARSESEIAATMRFGGGLDIYSFETDSVVITAGAEYVLPFGNLEDFDYVAISVGVLYRF
jgi:opacity protein-like surface antigen